MADRHPIGIDRSLEGIGDEQSRVYEKIIQGPRGSVPSPFLAMLDAPNLADAIQKVGAQLRFAGNLSDADRELAILATAAATRCGYEWHYHKPVAEKAGVDREAIDATRSGITPETETARWAVLIRFCEAVVRDHTASDTQIAEIVTLVGRQGATELIAICGYYALLASFIKIGKHDLEL